MTTWVRQKMSRAVQNVTTIEAAERILAARSVLVMGFFGALEVIRARLIISFIFPLDVLRLCSSLKGGILYRVHL
jgi:hypothetical protein